MKKIVNLILVLILAFSLSNNYSLASKNIEIKPQNSPYEMAKQGCCSWHGGVCGCFAGRVQCCDGTLSPSCRCYFDSKTNKYYIYAVSSTKIKK